jgi:hypothetical protein
VEFHVASPSTRIARRAMPSILFLRRPLLRSAPSST